jgi:retron-type reverse transcriptase
LDADVAKCFDTISHTFLMEKTPICDKIVLEQWLKSGVLEGRALEKTTQATLVLSPQFYAI